MSPQSVVLDGCPPTRPTEENRLVWSLQSGLESERERSGGHNLAPFGGQRPLRSHCIIQMTSSTMRRCERPREKARRVGRRNRTWLLLEDEMIVE